MRFRLDVVLRQHGGLSPFDHTHSPKPVTASQLHGMDYISVPQKPRQCFLATCVQRRVVPVKRVRHCSNDSCYAQRLVTAIIETLLCLRHRVPPQLQHSASRMRGQSVCLTIYAEPCIRASPTAQSSSGPITIYFKTAMDFGLFFFRYRLLSYHFHGSFSDALSTDLTFSYC
jgi:hypothetical protein